MKVNRRTIGSIAAAVTAGLLALSCNEINRQTSPVQLLVTNTNSLLQVDISPAATGCNRSLSTIQVQALLIQAKSLSSGQNFNDVRLDRYTVNYSRTDGGKLIPQPFTRAIDTLISVGAASSALNNFLVFEPNALNQAPFAALFPQNGGRDPDTGLRHINMNITLTVFGQTLAGERLSGSTTIPVDFCFDCGGCF